MRKVPEPELKTTPCLYCGTQHEEAEWIEGVWCPTRTGRIVGPSDRAPPGDPYFASVQGLTARSRTTKTVRAAVFAHPEGWQFLVPGFWVFPDDHDSPGYASLSIDAMMFGIGINCKATWVEIPVDADGVARLTHEEGQLIGRQFAHGAIKVLKLTEPLVGVRPYA